MLRYKIIKGLLTTCFHYNSEEISSKFPIPKIKLNMIGVDFPCASSIMKCFDGFEKMAGFYNLFLSIFLGKFTHFNPSGDVFPILLFNGLMMVTNE